MSIAVTPTVDFDILTSIGIKATDVFTTLRTNGTVWRTVTPSRQIQPLRSKHDTFRRFSRLSNRHTSNCPRQTVGRLAHRNRSTPIQALRSKHETFCRLSRLSNGHTSNYTGNGRSIDWRTVTARHQYRRFVQNMTHFAVFLAFQTVTPQTALNGRTDSRSTGAP
jgi:hypothetical protein